MNTPAKGSAAKEEEKSWLYSRFLVCVVCGEYVVVAFTKMTAMEHVFGLHRNDTRFSLEHLKCL